MKLQAHFPGGLIPVVDAGTADPGAGVPGSATAVSTPGNGHKDLTVFFTIGVVIDVLLVTAFLVWAVGQWRKKK